MPAKSASRCFWSSSSSESGCVRGMESCEVLREGDEYGALGPLLSYRPRRAKVVLVVRVRMRPQARPMKIAEPNCERVL